MNRADNLVGVLSDSLTLASDLESARARAIGNIDPASAFNRARDLANAGRERPLLLLDRQLVEAVHDARVRAHVLAGALAGALRLVHARALAVAVARQLDYAYLPDFGTSRDPDRGLAAALENACAAAHALTSELERAYACAGGHGQRGARRVSPSAAGLLAAAVRLLPAADRGRYAEEYRSELWDLAQAGAGRIGQLRYALCQLRSALSVSAALRSPRRRSVAP